MRGWLRRNPLFLALVVAPTLAAVVYFGLIAADVYVSESRFVVRNQQQRSQAGLVGQLLQGSGITHTEDDTYSVHDYILSRDALRELDRTLDLRAVFSRPQVDVFDRFPGLGWNRSFEELYRYYGRHVEVEYDPLSSISTLTVRAFTAEDAHKINDLLLQLSERLANTLNERSRRDLIGFADDEVRRASDKAKDASIALLNYRSSHSIFEPDREAAVRLEGVAKIQQALVETEAEAAQVRKLSPENPQIASLNGRADALRKAIRDEAATVTGARGSYSARAPEFERLALDVEFADKQLGVALAELESARADAQQKQIYIERLVEPNLPDKAMEPRRWRAMLTTLLFTSIFWGVASLVIASVREHAD